MTVTNEMIDRFLSWKLPDDFSPDAGISFKKVYNEQSPFGPSTHEPTGTNLLNAEQARAMLEYVLGDRQAAPSGEASHSDSQTRALEMVSAFTKVLEAIPAKTDTSGRSDPLYAVACALVRAHKKGSISLVQRHLRIGYNRAAMLLEAMVGDVITEMPPTSKMLAARLPGDGDKGEAS